MPAPRTPSARVVPLDVLTAKRPARSEQRQRSHVVGVRVTTDQLAAMTAEAEKRGLTVPELFRLGWSYLSWAEQIAELEDTR